MPLRTSAGIARLATASRPSRTRPMMSARANGRSSLRRLKRGSAARAESPSLPGVPASGAPAFPGVAAVRVDVAGVLAGPGQEQPVQRAPVHQLVVAADI